MTLNLEKFIANSIQMQAKIQHLDISTKTVKDPPESVKKIILDEYGEKYLDDADYVAFFWGPIGKDEIEKLFNVVDRALGKSANKLTSTDFKKIKVGNESDSREEQPSAEDIDDEQIADDAEDSIEVDDEDVETDDEEQLDEDDALDAPPKPTAHFFLKITLK